MNDILQGIWKNSIILDETLLISELAKWTTVEKKRINTYRIVMIEYFYIRLITNKTQFVTIENHSDNGPKDLGIQVKWVKLERLE